VRIGIDVGGTNTDAVLMDQDRVVAAVKTSTAGNVTDGITEALRLLQAQRRFEAADIAGVMIGTTHFINALVEHRRLAPTAAVRLGLPATSALPPMTEWPDELVSAISGRQYLCHGGHEFDGRVFSELDEAELKAVADDLGERGIRSIAITSVFSPVTDEFERRAAEILLGQLPGLEISLSHEIGRVGLIERENATIINAALRLLAQQVVDGLESAIRAEGIEAPLYLSQNDGTVMDVGYARRYPVATFASGPTNSMRGAAFLSGQTTCAVVDIGGTTTDIGVLRGGFPRESNTDVSVAGVRTNFRMPDVLSLGIGGGSHVHAAGMMPPVGPTSVGYRLTKDALVFGGDTLTATDIAVASGRADIGDASRVAGLDRSLVDSVLRHISAEVLDAVDRMRTGADPLPIVAVGGGSILLPETVDGTTISRPDHFATANAVGAAIAQVSGEIDRVYSVAPGARESVLDDARGLAVARAIAAGATPSTVEIVEVDEVPLAYLPGNATRVHVKAVGTLNTA
jgi:N-methylhydantoinase A/oxoprolinase/acetone carboxylase beta subunit